MPEVPSDVRAAASALVAHSRDALADGQRTVVLDATARVLAGEAHGLMVTVALGERVRALHELGDIAEARRLWQLIEPRLDELAATEPSFVHRIAVVGADLAQFGAGGMESALDILRITSAHLRQHGEGHAADLIGWDAVRRLGYAGRHRDLLTAIATLGAPPAALELELTVPRAIAEALDGSPRAAADRLTHALARVEREPQPPPLVEQGFRGALVLASVWSGEPARVTLSAPDDPWLQSSHALFTAMLAIARLDWRQAAVCVEKALQTREDADATGLMNVVHVVAAQVAAARGDDRVARDHLRARDASDERLSATTRADLDYRSAMVRIALGENPRDTLADLAERVPAEQLALPELWLDHARAVFGLPGRSATAYLDRLDHGAPAIAARLAHLQALAGDSLAARRRAATRVAEAGVWVPSTIAAARLTSRQREVAELVAQGLTNREIASHLKLSVRTVDSHVAEAMRRLGASTRAEATEALRSISRDS